MASDYSCPYCHADIPLDDVKVAKDIALCRGCGQTVAFSTLSGENEIDLDVLKRPPRGVRVEHGFRGEAKIIYHRLSPVLLFLIPFTAFWSGFSMYGIYWKQIASGKFDSSQSPSGLPFLIGTVILLGIIVFLIFGKWTISLDRGEGAVFLGVGPIGYTRRFFYNKSTIVSMCMTKVSVNNQPQKGIQVRTDDKDFVFGALIKENAKQFIAAAIMQEVSRG